MRVGDLGEFGLIDRIARAARRAGAGSGRDVVLGIGDDAALLRPRRGEDVVITTDAFVEDVHFRWRSEAPRTVGRRALVANLSDLAAMGARPLGFTFALAAPATLAVRRFDGVVAGLLHEGCAHGCPLVGGNVTRARETSLSITAVGAVARGRALTRAGARPGDRLLVTGTLGGAALAVARAERGRGSLRRVAKPRLAEARALARVSGVGACIDISDGLGADLGHLLGRTLCVDLDPARLPRPRGFDAACAREGLDPVALLLGGGEDNELLFTLRPGAATPAALARRMGVAVTEVGRVQRRRPGRAAASGGSPGWRHF